MQRARRGGSRGAGRCGRGEKAAFMHGRARGRCGDAYCSGPSHVSCVQPDQHLSKKALRSKLAAEGDEVAEGDDDDKIRIDASRDVFLYGLQGDTPPKHT